MTSGNTAKYNVRLIIELRWSPKSDENTVASFIGSDGSLFL